MARAHIAQVVVHGRIHGQDYRNVMHFGTDTVVADDVTDAFLLALATAMMQCWVTVLLPGLSSDFELVKTTAKRIFPAVTDEKEERTGAGPGQVAGHALPSFCSSLVAISTGSGGRRFRGRMFLPPPLETAHEDSVLTVDGQALVAAFLACLAGKFLGATPTSQWWLGVVSRAAVAGGATIGASFRDATVLTARPTVAVQRRRKVGVGS